MKVMPLFKNYQFIFKINMNENKTSGTAITALILAILAIIFAWVAFNRSGADLEDIIEREVKEATQEAREELRETENEVRTGAAAGLNNAAVDVSADRDPNNAGE